MNTNTAAPSQTTPVLKPPVRVAVVGAGYWGINHVRAFSRLPGCELVMVCDTAPQNLKRARGLAQARQTPDFAEVLADPDVDAVVLATPAVCHAQQTTAALHAGKHVLVEKPLALNAKDASLVQAAARSAGRVLMIGHLMLYHAAVRRLKQMIEDGEIGQVYYLYALRVNLGRLRQDENAMWSLAPHDISVLLHLLGQVPVTVAARGHAYLQAGVEDVVFLNLEFADGKMAQIQVSWLDPRKERRLTVVGERRMVEFDDSHPTEKLRIYDKGFHRPPEFTQFGEFLTVRNGDIHIPHLDLPEPLNVECRHFIECIQKGQPPRSGAQEGLDVIRVLGAADKSLRSQGAPVQIEDEP